MKKLRKLKLTQKSLAEIKAGNENNYPNTVSFTKEGRDLASACACGCAGCIWEDGGTGFSIGMMRSNLY